MLECLNKKIPMFVYSVTCWLCELSKLTFTVRVKIYINIGFRLCVKCDSEEWWCSEIAIYFLLREKEV
jgi:hypothetical protein